MVDFPRINVNELIDRGIYCSDWSSDRIARAKQSVKEYIAYCYWDQAGRPECRDLEFWILAERYLNTEDCVDL